MTYRKSALTQLPALGAAVLTLGATLSMTACNSGQPAQQTSGFVPLTQHSRTAPRVRRGGTTGSTVSVDMRQYMAVTIAQKNGPNPTGYMLCDVRSTRSDHCNTSLTTNAGEARLVSSKGGAIDYIAITSFEHKNPPSGSSPYYIGVIRNWTGPASGNVLRCFSSPNKICGSPADSSDIPEGVPYLIPNLPVVGYKALQDATNPIDGSPLQPIAGSLVTTPKPSTGNYWKFGIWYYNSPSACAQSYYSGGQTQTRIVYVNNVPFGGTIGTSDAIVIDGYSGATSVSDHVERYIYVLGYGRVGSGVAYYDPQKGVYDNKPHYAATHSLYEKINSDYFNFQGEQCGQGSYIPLWPSLADPTAAGF